MLTTSKLTFYTAAAAALATGTAGWVFSQTPAPQAAQAPAAQKGGGAPQIGGAPDPNARPNAVEHIKVHGKSLEGNLLGDSPDRDVFVYLPPSYQTSRNRRYPVVYLLHGYGLNAERYVAAFGIPVRVDKDIAAGTAKEMILVNPDAFNKYNGSMYSSSPTNGDWETFITQELVAYIDSHYRTIATRASRGLTGHSMGGYGTWRLAMKYPEVYSSIYAMSSCCLMNNPQPPGAGGAGRRRMPSKRAAKQAPRRCRQGWQKGRQGRSKRRTRRRLRQRAIRRGGRVELESQEASAVLRSAHRGWQVRPEIAAKWVANSPLAMVDQYLAKSEEVQGHRHGRGLAGWRSPAPTRRWTRC